MIQLKDNRENGLLEIKRIISKLEYILELNKDILIWNAYSYSDNYIDNYVLNFIGDSNEIICEYKLFSIYEPFTYILNELYKNRNKISINNELKNNLLIYITNVRDNKINFILNG